LAGIHIFVLIVAGIYVSNLGSLVQYVYLQERNLKSLGLGDVMSNGSKFFCLV